jgi:hypothetical protein
MGLKERTAARFKAVAVLSSIIFAGSNFVFRSTKAAIEVFYWPLYGVALLIRGYCSFHATTLT